MVETAVLTAVVSGGVGLLGVLVGEIINHRIATRQQHAHHERRRAEYFMDRQAEALITLVNQLDECHDVLDRYANRDTVTRTQYDDHVRPQIGSFETTVRRSRLYLPEPDHETLKSTL